MRLAGTAGRCFKPGILVRKKRGHSCVGMVGFLIESGQNPAGYMLAKVLTEKTIMNWPLEQLEIIE